MLLIKPKKSHYLYILALVFMMVSCASAPEKKIVVDPLAGVTDPEQIRVIRLQMFGPDPYIAKAPLVPAQAKADFDAAMLKLNSGDESGSETQLKALIKTYPTLSGPAYNLAVLKLKQGKKKAAKKYVNLAIERNSYNLNARNLRALMLRGEGDFAGAEKEYLEIIGLWKGYLPAYKNLGILYDNLYMGTPEKALVQYKNYNSLLQKPEKQVVGWIVDIERQLKPKAAPVKVESTPDPVAEPAQDTVSSDSVDSTSPPSAGVTESSPVNDSDETKVLPQSEKTEEEFKTKEVFSVSADSQATEESSMPAKVEGEN